jgi:hypothetical protein
MSALGFSLAAPIPADNPPDPLFDPTARCLFQQRIPTEWRLLQLSPALQLDAGLLGCQETGLPCRGE